MTANRSLLCPSMRVGIDLDILFCILDCFLQKDLFNRWFIASAPPKREVVRNGPRKTAESLGNGSERMGETNPDNLDYAAKAAKWGRVQNKGRREALARQSIRETKPRRRRRR